MKKTIAFLVIGMMTLSACSAAGTPPPDDGNGTETPQEEPVETPVETPSGNETDDEINEEVLADFEEGFKGAEDPLEVRAALDAIMEKESEKTNDAALTAYLTYLRDFQQNGIAPFFDEIQKLQPFFEEGTQNLTEESITDESLKDLHNRFTEMGYRFVQVEGSVEPVADYRIIEDYAGSVSDEMLGYGEFKSMESEQMWAADAGIVISIEELGERIAAGEAFLAKYPETAHKPDVILELRNYLSGFFGGLDNTPVDDDNKYSEEFITAYEGYMEKHPDTKTAEVLKTYYDELEETDFAAPYNVNDPDSRRLFKEQITYKVDEVVNGL